MRDDEKRAEDGAVIAGATAAPIGPVADVATSIGMSLTSAALAIAASNAPVLVAMALLTVVLGAVTAQILSALAEVDTVTAFLASMPNGPVEMAQAMQMEVLAWSLNLINEAVGARRVEKESSSAAPTSSASTWRCARRRAASSERRNWA